MKEETARWLEQVQYDLATAEAMLRTRRYVHVVFMSHLCLEKALKACVIEFKDAFPPYTHSLMKLSATAGIEFPEEIKRFVAEISEQGVVTRYPQELRQFTRARASGCLEQTRKAFSWLQQKLTSNE